MFCSFMCGFYPVIPVSFHRPKTFILRGDSKLSLDVSVNSLSHLSLGVPVMDFGPGCPPVSQTVPPGERGRSSAQSRKRKSV